MTRDTFKAKGEPTSIQKLDAVIAELTILLPRLTPQFRSSAETCIQYLKDVKASIETIPE